MVPNMIEEESRVGGWGGVKENYREKGKLSKEEINRWSQSTRKKKDGNSAKGLINLLRGSTEGKLSKIITVIITQGV